MNPGLTFALAAALAAGATFVARALAPALGLVSKPNPLVARHVGPVACLGGLGVAAGPMLALALTAPAEWSARAGLFVPALLFLLLGIADDRRPFAPLAKLLAQCALAALAVGLGAASRVTGIPALDAALAFAWIVTLVNAFNVLDVCDGLLAGVALVFFVAIALAVPPVRMPASAAAGACLGFLAFNRPRATIFLGDGGSHFLGFLAAALALAPRVPAADARDVVATLLALAVPLFETAFLIWARTARGVPWWRGSRDHFALRLQAAGWGPWRTIVTAWAGAAVLAGLGLALKGWPLVAAAVVAVGTLLVALGAARWLALRTEPIVRPTVGSAGG